MNLGVLRLEVYCVLCTAVYSWLFTASQYYIDLDLDQGVKALICFLETLCQYYYWSL